MKSEEEVRAEIERISEVLEDRANWGDWADESDWSCWTSYCVGLKWSLGEENGN